MSDVNPMKAPMASSTVIGWREWIALPQLELIQLRAKIDTGARTAALHAKDLNYQQIEGVDYVSFVLPFDDDRRVSLPVHGKRRVRNTGGVPEVRTTVCTEMVLGDKRWPVVIALSNRDNMLNPIILGRTSVRGRKLTINPGRSFLQGMPLLDGVDQ